MSFTITTLATVARRVRKQPLPKRRKAATPKLRHPATTAFHSDDPPAARELRNKIFPTLYAIFQQSRGSPSALKIKNRSLRSLLKSCLYHKAEDQLRRTLEDAEALLQKYCRHLEQ